MYFLVNCPFKYSAVELFKSRQHANILDAVSLLYLTFLLEHTGLSQWTYSNNVTFSQISSILLAVYSAIYIQRSLKEHVLSFKPFQSTAGPIRHNLTMEKYHLKEP